MYHTDFVVENHGSIFLFRPVSDAGREFLETTAPEDAQFFGTAMAVGHSYVMGVIDTIRESGLEVR